MIRRPPRFRRAGFPFQLFSRPIIRRPPRLRRAGFTISCFLALLPGIFKQLIGRDFPFSCFLALLSGVLHACVGRDSPFLAFSSYIPRPPGRSHVNTTKNCLLHLIMKQAIIHLPYILVTLRISLASPFFMRSLRSLQTQLPPSVDGVLMRAVLSRPI